MGILEVENYLLNDWENQIKFRSKRQKKRAVIEAQDKRLIRLYREDKELSKRKYNLPMIDLTPPIQKGWKRYFIVREDVRRSKHGVFYENLLQKINTVQYSNTKEFKQKKRKLGRKIYGIKEQKLRFFYPYELPKMKFTEKELACFVLKTKVSIKGKKIIETQYYEMNEAWRYVLRIRPNIIDKVKAHDEELEQRLAELRGILFDNYHNEGRLTKICDWGYRRWDRDIIHNEKLKYGNPLKKKALHQILSTF